MLAFLFEDDEADPTNGEQSCEAIIEDDGADEQAWPAHQRE